MDKWPKIRIDNNDKKIKLKYFILWDSVIINKTFTYFYFEELLTISWFSTAAREAMDCEMTRVVYLL